MHAHELPGSIIDEYQQCVGWRSVFKPPWLRIIDLDQFAESWPTKPRLLDFRFTPSTGPPEPSFDHEFANGLIGHRDAVTLEQLLRCTRWPKV